jgi:hypothetical protein
MEVHLSRSGMIEMLKSGGVQEVVDGAAEAVASGIGTYVTHAGRVVDVDTYSYTTPISAAAAVTIADPAGLAIEAKHGVLARGASGAGLKFSGR